MERNEFVDPIDSIEFRERRLHRDPGSPWLLMRTSCQQWEDKDADMAVTRHERFDEYDTTIVSTLHPDHGWTDPALVSIERRQSAVVMTAWNPGVIRPSLSENRHANDRLRAELEQTGYEVWRADGRAPDGSFMEEGWIVWEMPMDLGLSIAARFGQFAIFTYDEAGQRVTVACPE
jgi:hypothetical protein